MKINQITKLNNKNLKNEPGFGNFIVVKLPYDRIPDGYSLSQKKVAKSAQNVIAQLAEEIKKITNGQLNLFVRNLRDMGFREKHCNGVYEDFAKKLYIEDNDGKNRSGLIKVSDYLIEKGFNFKTYAQDLFAPKKKGLFQTSILYDVAYGAEPEDMIKL